MEKFIILAGSPNVGKTITVNYVIKKLIELGFKEEGMLDDKSKNKFWTILDDKGNPTTGGNVKLAKDSYKILAISYGDKEDQLKTLFNLIDYSEYNAIICCSHATWGRNVFKFFYKKIEEIDLKKTKIIPLHKNFLFDATRMGELNNYTADLIIDLVQKI